MTISFNIEQIPEADQFRLYQFLKNKFDVKSKDEMLNTSLSDFHVRGDISTRTNNLLKSMRLQTLLQLSQYPKSLFPKYRGIGNQTMKEIKDLLNKYGVEFAEEY